MFEILSETGGIVKVAIWDRYSPQDGRAVLDLIGRLHERHDARAPTALTDAGWWLLFCCSTPNHR